MRGRCDPEASGSGAIARALAVDVVTIFPAMLAGAFEHSIIGRARAAGLVDVRVHDLRDFTTDPHRSVDDAPFGGGGGMVLKPEPLFRAVESLTGHAAGTCPAGEAVVLLAAAGTPFDQRTARRYAMLSRLVLLCGRYEGVDERVRTHLATECVSIGDYVLSGGEPAASVVVDAVVRLLHGALGNESGTSVESHEDGLLEAPHYTRPAMFRGLPVPESLLTGNHAAIRRFRRRESLRATATVRPDLMARAELEGRLDAEDLEVLHDLGLDRETVARREARPRGAERHEVENR
jgi:tRNA (guanine37-N1)-methyltransferase